MSRSSAVSLSFASNGAQTLSGTGQTRSRFWEVELEPEARAWLGHHAASAPSPHADFLRFSVACCRLTACLPDPLLMALILFRTQAEAPGAMLIKGLPLDFDLAPTPADGGRSDKGTFVSEAVLGTIAHFFGDLYSYATEKKGEIIQNIVPVANRELKRSNEGSFADFLLHTENAYFEFRPDYLLLLGLRADEGGKAATTVAYAKDALGLVSDQVTTTLRMPLYRIAAPDSFLDSHGGRGWSKPTPLISGSPQHPEARVNFNGITALIPAAATALGAFQETLDAVTMKVVLQPGELLIIDNRKTMHGRTPFKATFGPQARWLQRAYVRSTLWHGREKVAGRPNLFDA